MTSTHKHHIITIQYPPHKCLPEKSCLHCLRILIMSWLFKDPVVIMKEIMSWLFKDPINIDLAQFDHAQSNSTEWPQSWKDQIKFSCTYEPLSFCKIFKKFLELIQSYEDVPFSASKWSICPEQIFLVQTIIITLIYLLGLFIVQNLKKFIQPIQSCDNEQFLGPKWPISPDDNFFQKTC